MNVLGYVLQAAAQVPQRGIGIQGFIFGTVVAVSILLVSVGFLYVLMKLGRFLDAMKDKV